MRQSNRAADEMRPISFERHVNKHAEGSCLVKFGETHVLCTASFEERPPRWLRGSGQGWITAEYGMLPRSTSDRMERESTLGKVRGRTQEIQRLIGRSLRAVVDLRSLGEVQIKMDCDVLQADGGTRTAAISGSWVALYDCLNWMEARSLIQLNQVLHSHIAAVSVGLVGGKALLDLDYGEDSSAETDANFVLTEAGDLVEIQATAEETPFNTSQLMAMMELAQKGADEIIQLQKHVLR